MKIDFSDDEEIFSEIEHFLAEYDIGVLVNNVGISATSMPFLDNLKHTPNLTLNMTRINMFSVLKVSPIQFSIQIIITVSDVQSIIYTFF